MKHWSAQLTPEAMGIAKFARDYAKNHASVPIPARNLIMTVDALVDILEEYDRAFLSFIQTPVIQQVAWSADPNDPSKGCWRDLYTGIRVELVSTKEQREHHTPEH